MILFWISMYTAYPRAGAGKLFEVDEFNSWDTALKAMFDNFIAGRKFAIDMNSMSELEAGRLLCLFVYLFIYVVCVLLVSQLMYRFLNAALTAKFNAIQKESTLQWRLNFARKILRAESIWMLWSTSAGDAEGNYQFQHIEQKLSPPDDPPDDDGSMYIDESDDEMAPAVEPTVGSPATAPETTLVPTW